MKSVHLKTRIIKLEISYFKSFAGINKFNYFELLNAVYGLNGAGKSNFLDAFAFCFNENLNKLRISKAEQLIYSHSDPSEKTNVKCTFLLADGSEKSFTKEINGSSFKYLIDDQRVEEKQYVEKLMNIGINVKNNLIIYQQDIHAIATQDGKQLTDLFERVSGSISFRQEYQRLWDELEQARLDKKSLFDDKKKLITDQKRLREISKSNRISLGLQQDYEKYLTKVTLVNLYLLDEKKHAVEENMLKLQQKKEKIERKIQQSEQQIKPLKKAIKDYEKKITNFELKSSKNDSKRVAAKAKFEELDEQITKDEKKIKSAKQNLEKAQECDKSRVKAIEDLEEALRIEKEKMKEFLDASIQDQVYLEKIQQQEKEYQRLKTVVLEKTVPIVRELDTLELRRGEFHNRMANLQRQLDDVNNKLEKQSEMLSKDKSELKEIISKIEKTDKELEEVRQDIDKLKLDTEISEKQQEELTMELDQINEEIHALKLDKSQVERANREEEALAFLKKTVNGVFGRLYQECRPVHSRYKIPMAKVFGDFFSAIVVDTQETAFKCIELLDSNHLTFERFLPLDNLRVHALQERLRNPNLYDGIKNVKLLYDVLNFSPKISNAVLFVTQNTLVCETSKDANYVAYDLNSGEKHNCVSLDGTFYKKNGSFSGGKSSVSKKAQLLDSQRSKNLVARKEEIIDAIKKGQKYVDSRSELESLEMRYGKLKWETKYLKDGYNKKESKCNELKDSITKLTDEQKCLQLQLEETQEELDKFNPQLKKLQDQIAPIENKVFKDFCKNLGIKSVKEYVNQLRLQEEKLSKLRKIKERIERIEGCIEYESNKNSSNNVKRWSDIVETLESDILNKKIEIEGLKKDYKALEKEEQLDKQKLDSMNKELKSNVDKLKQIEADIEKNKDKILEILSLTEDPNNNGTTLKADYHDFILRAKNENIELPLLEDSIPLENLYELIESIEPDEDYDSQKLDEVYELENDLKLDYDYLLDDLTNDSNLVELLTVYENKLADLRQKLISMPTSSTVESELDEVREKLDQNNEEHKKNSKKIKQLTNEFEKIQKLRYETFMECFESVREKLDGVYKKITGHNSAQAFLLPINMEEPYIDDIRFKFVPPLKQNRGPVEPSGGEKTLAALALLLSMHGDQHAPIFLLDEIDADLDSNNVKSIIKFFQEAKNNQQIIFISHNHHVISNADMCFGFQASTQSDHSVRTKYLRINLKKYKDN